MKNKCCFSNNAQRKSVMANSSAEPYHYLAELYFTDLENKGHPLSTEAKVFWDNIFTLNEVEFLLSDKVISLYNENEVAALTSLINPSQPMALAVNAPIFTAWGGYQLDGVTNFIDMNFNPSTDAVNYALNSGFFGEGITVGISQGSGSGCSDGTNIITLFPDISTLYYGVLNSTSHNQVSNVLGVPADYFVKRTDSSNNDLYRNDTILGSNAIVSSAKPNASIYLGAWNNNTVAANFQQATFNWGAIGGAINVANFRTNFTTQLTGM